MSSKIIASTSSGTALNMSADTSGILEIQTGSGPTTAITIDTSQNVGIGTTTPSTKLNVYGSSPSIYLEQNTGVAGNTQVRLNAAGASNTASVRLIDKYIWTNTGNGSLLNIGNDLTTAQMAIDSSGNVLVGTTNSSQSAGNGVKMQPYGACWLVNGGGDSFSYYNSTAGLYRFYVNSSGTISATNTSINGISDIRLKENIRDLDDGLNVVMALKPRKFDWKEGKGADTKNARGFIAQEFEQVLPDLISEWKDPAPEGEEPYKSVRADLIPTLVKAIQELNAKVDAQALEIQALKGVA